MFGNTRTVGIWDQLNVNGKLNVNGNANITGDVKVNKLNTRGFTGPFLIHPYDKDDGTCWDAGQNGGLGTFPCTSTNPWQRFWVSPVTGQLYNEQKNQCLDIGDNNVWNWVDCNNHQRQQFTRKEHTLQWRNQDCVDVGSATHHYACDGNNANQKFRYEYVG